MYSVIMTSWKRFRQSLSKSCPARVTTTILTNTCAAALWCSLAHLYLDTICCPLSRFQEYSFCSLVFSFCLLLRDLQFVKLLSLQFLSACPSSMPYPFPAMAQKCAICRLTRITAVKPPQISRCFSITSPIPHSLQATNAILPKSYRPGINENLHRRQEAGGGRPYVGESRNAGRTTPQRRGSSPSTA